METNVRIGICALLGFFLTVIVFETSFFEFPSLAGILFFGFIVTVFGTVIFFITNPYFITKPDEKAESESSTIEKQIDNTTIILLYILSFFIPLAGFIVGAIYASKDEEHYKHVGKNCLIFSVLNLVLGFIMIAAILGSM